METNHRDAPEGLRQMTFSNFVSGSTITLQRWGQHRGPAKIGPRPGTNETVLLSGDGGINSASDFKATTDERGRFSWPTFLAANGDWCG
jgi:hypothetical protein